MEFCTYCMYHVCFDPLLKMCVCVLLPPPGGITIRRVCLLVGVFVTVFVRYFASGHRLQCQAGGSAVGGR